VPPRWLLPPSDVEVMLGDPVILDCLVSGTPRPSIKWSIADEKIPGKFRDISAVADDFRCDYNSLNVEFRNVESKNVEVIFNIKIKITYMPATWFKFCFSPSCLSSRQSLVNTFLECKQIEKMKSFY
jgi:hypothetical protein